MQISGIKYLAVNLTTVLVLLALFVGQQVNAQVSFSTDHNYLKTKTDGNNLLSVYKNNYPDTSIDNLSQFEPRNFRGNTGLAQPAYLIGYGTADAGFGFSPDNFGHNKFTKCDVLYGETKGPYANLTGIAGDAQLQMFKLFYSQSFGRGPNLTLKFNRYNSLGFYQKQQAITNNFFVSSNYQTKNKRFGYYTFLLNNGNKNQENTGITDRILSDSTVLLNKQILSVNTHSATRDNRELKFEINPWFCLNADSLNTTQHYIEIKSLVSNSTFKYKDVNLKNENLYRDYYYDTLVTNDSTHLRQYTNELNYVVKNRHYRWGFSLGYKNEINKLWQKHDSLMMNNLVTAAWQFSSKAFNNGDSITKNYFTNQLKAQYIVNGKNEGNYKIENNFVYWLDDIKQHKIYFNALAENRSADYIYNYWLSNHFKWQNNNYKSQLITHVNMGLAFAKLFKLEVFYQNIFRTLYFDEYALPRQYDKTIENIGISVKFSKLFFKHLGLALEHTYQSTNKPAFQRLPANMSTAKLYYNGNLFKNVLQLQVGSQVQVYQSFYGYAYMPSTQAFYLQQTYATAAAPFIDVYLNARVKPVMIFVKVENALQGVFGNNYSFVPGYYQPDRAFRFGISWMFFD